MTSSIISPTMPGRDRSGVIPERWRSQVMARPNADPGTIPAMSRMRLSVGDVFQLPLDPSRVGYGQIVGRYGQSAYWFAIFEQPYEFGEEPDVADVVHGRIALLGLSLDALLYHDAWEVVGNAPVPEIKWPTYKEAVAPNVFEAVDHTGSIRRPATPEEADSLPYRSVVAPIRLQNAFRALHGAAEWNEEYDRLRYG